MGVANQRRAYQLPALSIRVMREFSDEQGVVWRVWQTVPSNAKTVAVDLRDGWLCFDSGSERRRFGPIPREWEEVTDERLRLALRGAVRSRTTPTGTPIPTDCEDDL
jgi:hypothetical protein